MKDDLKTVLVVEDERPLHFAIKTKLDKYNIETLTARTVKQAIDYLEDGIKVDAVWLDHYLMGQETGLDFLVYLKSKDNFSNLPIFIVSNTGSPDKRQAYLRLGATKYFVKSDNRLDVIIQEMIEFINKPD